MPRTVKFFNLGDMGGVKSIYFFANQGFGLWTWVVYLPFRWDAKSSQETIKHPENKQPVLKNDG